jgi:5-methylcytosine-specific restriction endonuclease McrA
MMRICSKCKEEKPLERFVRQTGKYRSDPYRKDCKDCKNKERRTGKPVHKFPKGMTPWNKGQRKPNEERARPKSSRPKIGYGKTRCAYNYRDWRRKVFERDGYKCLECGTTEKLHPHHIVSWKASEELRFSVDNGKTLCASCHCRLEATGRPAWNKGTKGVVKAWNKGKTGIFSDETRKSISEKLKANPVKYWKGKIRSEEDKEKMSKAKMGKPASWNRHQKSEETKRKISETKRNKVNKDS